MIAPRFINSQKISILNLLWKAHLETRDQSVRTNIYQNLYLLTESLCNKDTISSKPKYKKVEENIKSLKNDFITFKEEYTNTSDV